ncbi:zinc-binding dehydrogenase [Cryobacterium roopkundense]|uniref:NADPH:quinone reductase-like Zn-dependent oxidoreductase n=1 Tax=Cryobacterium roopkundense TaxID=1001240 RepID=A0A099JMN9_9MICO|nr:NADP-dependent oxidoreductase [Cryobacterium roopkundense]KGJ79609.1 zinc-binding dehydrogenase [Cryobacterium roopkundense]MBB5639818.1 NADPH:quinone reductase-like Zn-dependent oxidoreductase [Cryobacterium roopkundense]
MARYVMFDEFGGPDVLHIVHDGRPEAGRGELRVRVRFAGLNPVDYKILHGGEAAVRYNAVPPCGNGNDFSGVVDEVGDGVTGFVVGDAVFGGKRMQGQADWVVIDATRVIRLPDGLTFEQAGALDIAGRAAWASVRQLGLGADDTVLVSAAAGGVGVIACQLALRAGATVIGTASAGQHDFLRGLGVIPVEYGPGLVDRVRAVSDRVTAVLDYHGPETIDAGLTLGVPGARINTIAARGHRTGTGVTDVGGQAASLADLAQLAALIAAGAVVLPIDSVYPLEQVREAYARLMGGHLRGKIVLAVS